MGSESVSQSLHEVNEGRGALLTPAVDRSVYEQAAGEVTVTIRGDLSVQSGNGSIDRAPAVHGLIRGHATRKAHTSDDLDKVDVIRRVCPSGIIFPTPAAHSTTHTASGLLLDRTDMLDGRGYAISVDFK